MLFIYLNVKILSVLRPIRVFTYIYKTSALGFGSAILSSLADFFLAHLDAFLCLKHIWV